MGIVVVLLLGVCFAIRMVYITSSNAACRAQTNAIAARQGTHEPKAMTQEEIDKVAWDMWELQAHRDYTVAASSGQLPDLPVPAWKKVGTGLLVGDLAWRGVRNIEHHLDNRR